jgi:hypothetical protein
MRMEREENETESTNERTRMAPADGRMTVAARRENGNVARMVRYGRDPLRSCVEEISLGNPVEKHGKRAGKATTMEV